MVLIEALHGGKPRITVEKPLIVYERPGVVYKRYRRDLRAAPVKEGEWYERNAVSVRHSHRESGGYYLSRSAHAERKRILSQRKITGTASNF